MDDVNNIPAETRKLLLENMLNGPAFALFCERWEEKLQAVQVRINDPATSDAETRELKLVRKQCVETNHPRKIVETMIRTVGSEKPKTT